MRTRILDAAFELKALDERGSFSGYGSVFGVEDSDGEVVAPGAFARSLAAHGRRGRMPALLWQHDARQPIGVWTAIREDATGLYVEGSLLKEEVRQAAETHALLRAGAVSGLSIGFVTRKAAFDEARNLRVLTEIDLWEVSLVTFPANDAARVTAIKASRIVTVRDLERALREAGLSRSAAVAVASRFTAKASTQRDAGDGLEQLVASLARATAAITNR